MSPGPLALGSVVLLLGQKSPPGLPALGLVVLGLYVENTKLVNTSDTLLGVLI